MRNLLLMVALLATAAIARPSSSTGQHSPDSFTLAATGDYLGEVLPSNDSRVAAVWDLIQQADFSFFNMEGNLFDIETFPGYPGSENGKENTYGNVGGGAQYEASQAAALAEVGFNLASLANNHGFDWLEDGMFATHKHLREANITVAGGGESLQAARGAAFLTKDNITVALVAAAGTHLPSFAAGAGDASRRINPRPGMSVLRAAPVTLVSREQFDTIKVIAEGQGQVIGSGATDISLYVGQFPYQYTNWRLSPDGKQGLTYAINAADYQGILASIRAARQETEHVFFSFHGHESLTGSYDSRVPLPDEATIPADYIQNVSRSAIDAGAAAVLVHGPHHLRAVEVYQGKPIFYSLASMTYSLGLEIQGVKLPVQWDDSVVAVNKFTSGRLSSIELYPIVHGQLTNDTSDPESQLPKLAPTPEAQRILGFLQSRSEEFGTKITIRGDVGYVQIR
ncbi:hypothetical protein ACHAPT_009484 [Fusarium lateritium]